MGLAGWPECGGIEAIEGEKCRMGRPKLKPENERFVEFFCTKLLPGLFDGLGSCSYHNIIVVFDVWDIPGCLRPILFDKTLAVVSAIEELKAAKRLKGQEDVGSNQT